MAAVLVSLSLVSLGVGKRAAFLSDYARTGVSAMAYPFLKTLKVVENGYDFTVGFVSSYGSAQSEAEALHEELSANLGRLAGYDELKAENKRLREMLAFERETPKFDLEAVEVILRFEGMLMIDRGSLHGMQESMCVITKDGIIGMITQVDLVTSNVVTLHNAECKIDAMIQRTRVRGVVHGTGSEVSSICRMEYIDLKDDVRVGDSVVSSPDSVFPSGYPIGRVVEVNEGRGTLLKTVDVRPYADPYRADEVFVLRAADPFYEDFVADRGAEPDDPAEIHPLLVGQSIQERLAP